MTEQDAVIEQLRFDSKAVVLDVAEVVAGHSLGGDLIAAGEFLAKSPGIGARSDTEFPQLTTLTEVQIDLIRADSMKIGIGAEGSTGLKEAGLPDGSVVVCEGGLPNKIMAQLKVATENERSPGLVVITASETRVAGAGDEKRMQQMSTKLEVEQPNITGKTELEIAALTASMHPEFTAVEPTVLPFGYGLVDGGINPVEQETGQVVLIGNINGSPVVTIGVHELHRDDSGKNFYRPGVGVFTDLASDIAVSLDEACADKPVATLTSHLYGPSRRLQNPDTLIYGTKVMEEVVGPDNAEPTIQNIVSEIDRTREVLLAQAS